MIEIKELNPPFKLSGISSFAVKFDYKKDLVEIVKNLPGSQYHATKKFWEVPASSLQRLLDSLTFKDDIKITFAEDRPAEKLGAPLTEEEISKFKFKPFQHQIDAINYGLTQKSKWLLLDTMGAGKSNTIIWLAESLKRRGLIDHCFIICGVNALKQNWKKEINKFSTETCHVLGEKISKTGKISYKSVKERAKELMEPIDEFFVITNIETLRAPEIIEAYKKSKNKFGMIAVDEIHRICTASSTQGDHLLKISADYMVGATGTLITNSPESCYVPLKWTKNDKATLTNFRAQYCIYGGLMGKQIVGYKNLDLLKEELDSCSLRRTLDQIRDMPPKTITYELLEMEPAHRKFYEIIKGSIRDEMKPRIANNEFGLKVDLTSTNLLSLTTRLRQATSCPSFLTTENIPSTKVNRCVELVEELAAQGEKVVILATFKETVAVLAEALKKYNPMINTGDVPDQEVSANVDTFQNVPGFQIFLGTWAKVSTGLTLNAAQYLICIDTPYTYAMFAQGTDRIWRVNNTRPAFITVLSCEDTIDEAVNKIINTKKDLSDFVVDDVENSLASGTTQDDLLEALLRSVSL